MNMSDVMNNLKLPNPKMWTWRCRPTCMSAAPGHIARNGWALSATEAIALNGRQDVAIVDLARTASAPSMASLPLAACALSSLKDQDQPRWHAARIGHGDRQGIVFNCAFGERSAMAVQRAQMPASKPPATSRAASTLEKANGPLGA